MKDERTEDQSPENGTENRQVERDSQLSAMFDGQLASAECELLARRLSRDEALRGQWSRYALIGAALRHVHAALAVEHRRQLAVALFVHTISSVRPRPPSNTSRRRLSMASRARKMRERTVPTGHSMAAAISS